MKCGLVALPELSQLPIWPGISERLRQGCRDGEAKCRGQGAQPGPPRGHCRNEAAWDRGRDGWSQGAALLLGSADAAERRKSRKDKFRKVLMRGAHFRALNFSKESGYQVCGFLFRSIYNSPWFDLAGLGFHETPFRATKAKPQINQSLLLQLLMSSYGARAYG